MSLFKSLTSINNSISLNKNKNINNIYKNQIQLSKYDINSISVFYEDDASEAGDDFGNPNKN